MKQTYLPFSNPKLPPGAVFAAKKPGVSITGYKSRKVMFQGVNGEAEAKKWVATLPESKAKAPSVSKGILPANFASKNVIGSDEVGTGEFFWPDYGLCRIRGRGNDATFKRARCKRF